MLKNKVYTCEICKTKPDQLSHHKTHLDTQKHKDKKELFELKILKLSSNELVKLYNTTDISIIIDENETNTYIPIEDNKKLINNYFNNNDNDIYNKQMSDDEKQKVELSNNVSNKEALKDKIHEIHNYLRNNGAGYGMNALKVFNLLYGLKKIEEKKLLDKVCLKRPDCEFKNLLKLANENKDDELSALIRGNVLDSIDSSPIKNLLFYEIPKSMTGKTFSYLIKEIDKITVIEKTCNVLLSGKIYEYFIGRDESAISELGAYFTDRHIVDYIYKKLDPEINEDGSINSMIDMFGGSGGFTTGYINYLNDKYDNINWKDNINKIYHFDMNEDVVKSAGLEFFCLTGVLPNMKDNLAYRNSFTDKFENKKFMNVITNPPYGGDKVVQSDAQIKRKKIKEYIKKELLTLKDELKIKTRLRQIKKIEDQEKQEKKDSDKTKVSVEMCSQRIIKYAKDNKLTGNDKESSSLILIMDMVDVNGTAIGVLKEGVFFNKTYKDIRKCLVENFNVREIISVPQDQFENTSTKTSIVIFDNTTEKTSKVKFSELTVEKYTEDKFEEVGGEIVLIESKDDICGISDRVVSEATKEELLKNSICSLNGKDYNKREIVVGEGYELVKLGDICTFLQKSKRNASFGKSIGKYNFYTSSDKVQKCDIADYNEESLIIGDGGVANIKIDNIFSCSDHNHIINTKYNKYIFYLISGNMNFLIDGFSGSVLKNLSKTYLQKLELPIPKSKQKITEWVNKISKPYDKKNKNEELIMQLEEQIKNKIKDIGENEDCDEVELGSICEVQDGCKFKDTDLNTDLNTDVNNIPLIRATYITNKLITNYIKEDTKFDKYIVKNGDIIFSQVGNVGSMCKYQENRIGYNKMNAFRLRGINFNQNYLYYYLLSDDFKNKIFSNGSIVKFIKIPELRSIKVKIPKNKNLIKDFDPLFQEIEKLQTEMKEAELQYKKLIKELSEEAIPTNKQIEIQSDNKINELFEELGNNIIDKKVKETKKSKKIDNLSEEQLVQDIIETTSEQILKKKPKTTKNKVKSDSNTI
jgi:type I restriction-modification system DNA methylase subunit